MTAPLRRVLVRAPRADDAVFWQAVRLALEPDPARWWRSTQPSARCSPRAGPRWSSQRRRTARIRTPSTRTTRPSSRTRAPSSCGPARKEGAASPTPWRADFVEAGVPIAGRLDAPALAEGGDTVWLDEQTLLVGRGYRTNDEGIRSLRELLPDVDVIAFDLPHYHGASEVMHLMSFLSPLDVDLAAVYLPLMPVRLVEILQGRGIELVEVPDDEFESMGPNVLALGPRVALALAGNDESRRRMEKAGVDVRVYQGDHISRPGDGGPTCLTRPILRSA